MVSHTNRTLAVWRSTVPEYPVGVSRIDSVERSRAAGLATGFSVLYLEAAGVVGALPEMSDIGLIVPGMTEPPRRYDVTTTVDRDAGHPPNPAEFAVAAEQAASAKDASIVSAHTASQIISIVTVQAADQPAAVAVALAVVSDALRCRVGVIHPLTGPLYPA
jgi:hypothetical protein